MLERRDKSVWYGGVVTEGSKGGNFWLQKVVSLVGFLSKNGAESLFDGFSWLPSWPCLASTSTGLALQYHEGNINKF